MSQNKEDMKSVQIDLSCADKEISVRISSTQDVLLFTTSDKNIAHVLFCLFLCPQSLKKKVELLQKTLSTPTRTNETLSRLIFER